MMSIAECMGIVLYAREDGFVSFSNSPYYAHRHLAAVDIYPPRGSRVVYSPAEGRVVEARKLEGMDDYIIIMEGQGVDVYIKILHVKPIVQTGEYVKVGEVIGEAVWSPFYNFWTDPHIHVEVRPPNDRVRARGGFRLDPKPLTKNMRMNMDEPEKFTVTERSDRYLLLRPESTVPPYTTPLSLTVQNEKLILEGGLTHYGHGGLWNWRPGMTDISSLEADGNLHVDFAQDGYAHFTCSERRIIIRGFNYRGVSLYLNDPHIKLIPMSLGEVKLKVGDELSTREISPL
ncbi:MAG: M23 family metallopeptidase [Candidatus Bathyarchaeia archaeon]